jgi:hypothetical protein
VDPEDADAIQAERDTLRRALLDLRAALCHAMRLVRRNPQSGPQGLTVLSLATDREIIDEAHRLRQLADHAGDDNDRP